MMSVWHLVMVLPIVLGSPNPEGFINHLSSSDRKDLETAINSFLVSSTTPGLSIAITHNDELVYRAGFGLSDRGAGTPMTANTLLRIASVSKPITLLAILSLVQQGRLNLDSPVFGVNNTLGPAPQSNCSAQAKGWLNQLTVRHLLNHKPGGWADDFGSDPLNDIDDQDMASRTRVQHEGLTQSRFCLRMAPGEKEYYSNFGYFLLGQIVSRASGGQLYEAYVQEHLFAPLGVNRVRISADSLATRQPDEAVYEYAQDPLEPYTFFPYTEAADGGWAITPTHLVKLFSNFDGVGQVKVVLPQSLLSQFGLGGATFEHEGSLEGSFSSLVVDRNYVLAIVVNGESNDNFAEIKDAVYYAQFPTNGTSLNTL